MAWPCREELWGDHLEAARAVVSEIATAIARFEPVTMIARPDLTASASLHSGAGVSVLPMSQDDSWTRDTGPSFLIGLNGARAGVAWRFNGWGEAYENYAQDAQMAKRILEHVGAERFDGPITIEGGGLHVDGEGTCLVCETSVLDPKRNPGLGRAEAETALRDYLGVERIIWLPYGLGDDETGGHIDNIACFARPGAVIALATSDTGHPDHAGLQRNLEVLRSAEDAQGRKLEVLTLPMPKPRDRGDGRRLSTSYVNFYMANHAIVMPAFQDAADKAAFKAMATIFPDREIVQIDALDLLRGGGGIHCITQQEPA